MDKLLLTPAEAALCLGIGRSKLYELLSAGVIASVHIGNCRRIPTFALDAFVAELAERQATGSTAHSVGPAA
jgi:excisionase family DNA binding protein